MMMATQTGQEIYADEFFVQTSQYDTNTDLHRKTGWVGTGSATSSPHQKHVAVAGVNRYDRACGGGTVAALAARVRSMSSGGSAWMRGFRPKISPACLQMSVTECAILLFSYANE